MKKVILEDLKTIAYQEAWDLQEHLLKTGVDIKIKSSREKSFSKEIKNYLLICRHPHVYTLGKHGKFAHLLLQEETLKERGIEFYKTNRGGDITYHGPGQLVVYPVLDLEQFFTDLKQYMRFLEEAVILTLAEFGIKGERLPKSTGVWLDAEDPFKARKICALGVRCSRWITIHGLALNINTDLSYFNNIIPCGIANKGVTSMQKELKRKLDEKKVQQIFTQKFAELFKAEIITAEKSLLNSSTEILI